MNISRASKRLLNLHRIVKRRLSDYDTQQRTPRTVELLPIPEARYGGRHNVTMLPGPGASQILMSYVVQAFKMANVPVDFEVINIDPLPENNSDLDNAITSIRRNGVAIKGSLEMNKEDSTLKLPNVAIRDELDLYVWVFRCKSYPEIISKHKNVDVVVIRQNTKGEYSLLEHSPVAGVVECMKISTRENCNKLAKYAFEYAAKQGRKKITTVHKANVLYADILLLEAVTQTAKEYPGIEYDDVYVDTCCCELVVNPHKFDVIFTTNLYGNVVENILAGLTGGPALVAGKHYGDYYAVFEPGARRFGQISSVAMTKTAIELLHHLGHENHAKKLENAVDKTLTKDKLLSEDMGGSASNEQMITRILENYLRS